VVMRTPSGLPVRARTGRDTSMAAFQRGTQRGRDAAAAQHAEPNALGPGADLGDFSAFSAPDFSATDFSAADFGATEDGAGNASDR